MGITADIDTSKLEHIMRESVRLGGRSAKSAVMATSIFFAQSGRKMTPMAKKRTRREIRPRAGKATSLEYIPRTSRQSLIGWDIVLKHQNRPDTFVQTFDENDKRRRIPNKGAAKNSWSGVLRSLNRNQTAFSNGVGVKLGSARKRLNEFNPEVTITNSLSYLFKIAPHVDQQAIDKAANRMEAILDRRVKREIQKPWR